MERRLHSRHRATATVYIVVPGRRGALCKAHNLCANGVFVETRNLGLAKGSIVELAFAINLGRHHQNSSPQSDRRPCLTGRHWP